MKLALESWRSLYGESPPHDTKGGPYLYNHCDHRKTSLFIMGNNLQYKSFWNNLSFTENNPVRRSYNWIIAMMRMCWSNAMYGTTGSDCQLSAVLRHQHWLIYRGRGIHYGFSEKVCRHLRFATMNTVLIYVHDFSHTMLEYSLHESVIRILSQEYNLITLCRRRISALGKAIAVCLGIQFLLPWGLCRYIYHTCIDMDVHSALSLSHPKLWSFRVSTREYILRTLSEE